MVNKEMTITTDIDEDSLVKLVDNIVKKYEKGVDVFKKSEYVDDDDDCCDDCCHDHEHGHEHSHEHGHEHSHSHSHGKKKGKNNSDKDLIVKAVIRLVVGGGLFGAAISGIAGDYSVVLFVLAYLVFGYDVLLTALRNILRGSVFDENFLMGIATIGAFIIGEYPEGVAVMLFYQVGEFFQDMAVDRSTRSIKELMNLMPEFVNLVDAEGNIVKTSPKKAKLGDTIVIKSGEKVPLDCKVTSGEGMLDTSALTGESEKVRAVAGDSILSGSINEGGVLYAEVEKTYENTTVKKIMDMVENATANKSQTESFITSFARIYTPAVCIAAVLLFLIPTLMGYGWQTWLYRALVFLVSSCPCALVVSIPLTFFSGLGAASRHGVLIKGSNYVQTLSELNTAVFDKTGTLTKGVFKVTKVEGEKTAELCAALEKYSNHPIASAVCNYCNADLQAENVEEISGHGLKGEIDGKVALAGNARLMESFGIDYKQCDEIGTIVYVAYDNAFVGVVVVSDEIKADSEAAIRELNKHGIETVMLTGDRREIAEKTAQRLGVKKVYSQLLPQDKVSKVEELYSEDKKRVLAFVGDGINDAPVLARADVGVAMGGIGSDAAIEAADVVIMNDEVSKLYTAVKIAKNTMKLAKQNLAFVLVIKLAVLVLAACGFANMWVAVFADVGVALLAILNSLRKK
jgi:Cd2+/Zn2+-exporting ATPase